ncbi:hypothetical protein J0K78_11075 [Halobacillus sp. GSS1]|uniref:hypothetical protein n=1 Tax=Halobacillus sp. GSS1 TaxID=2815919 RepID=UPI001A8D008E|nr:hypothetical protein [Halobacillus sp. GSS1]MBN9654808.1 hypothetical protein [Halobacillus sp. GSS1]
MNTFVNNYWASYLDFIHAFKQLSYLGIPLPLVCPYFLLVHDNDVLLERLESQSTVLNTKIKNEKQLQSLFDIHFSPFHNKTVKSRGKVQGKVVFYDNVLRFPDQLMKENFSPSNALVLKRKTNAYGSSRGEIPVDSLEKYQTIHLNTLKAYQRKAEKHFDRAAVHPIYKNKAFRETFVKQIPGMMKQIIAAKKFFEQNAVSCLVTGTTNSSDTRILTLTAALKGIPSLCLQHGIVMLEFGYLPKVSTYQAVYGSSDIQWYQRKGIQPNGLQSIGHPRFDELVKRSSLNRAALHSHFKLDNSKKSVLVVIHHLETEFTKAVLKYLGEQGSVNIIIKQRNGKQRRSAQTIELVKEFPHLKFADDLHLYDLLNNVDAVISYESTIALEAMLAGKPIYLWRLKDFRSSMTNYYDELSMYIHDDPHALVDHMFAVMNAPSNKNWEKRKRDFLSTHYPHKPGTSSAKLKELIDSIKL